MASLTSASSSRAAVELAFVCNLCFISFESNSDQRTHMQSPWHVYNLKRRIASLPPISSKAFEETILTAKKIDDEAKKTGFKAECSACQKVYDKPKAYQNHLRSQGHRLATSLEREERKRDVGEEVTSPVQDLADVASKLEALDISEEASDESSSEDEEVPETETNEGSCSFDETYCLFCLQESPHLDQTMAHMQKAHGLFIPQAEDISDLPALLKYLHVIIVDFHQCLYCGSTKRSAEAARAHMLSKGHCMVNSEDVEGFYDFSEDEEAEEGAEDGEDIKGKSKQVEILVPEDDKLTLPSGKQLGHRSKSHIYRQHLPSPEVRAQRKAIADSTAESSNPDQSSNRNTQLAARAQAEMGLVGLSDIQKRSLRVVEKKMMKMEMRARNEYRAAVEKGANRQKFFKPDVPGPSNG